MAFVLIASLLALSSGVARAAAEPDPSWSQVPTATSPPWDWYAGPMAYDAASGKVIKFGGTDYGGDRYDQTWSFDGSTWTQLFPAHTPPAGGGTMGYDPVHKQLLLRVYGADSTYLWSKGDWVQISSAPSAGGTMVWDEQLQQLLMVSTGLTVAWTGTNWNWIAGGPPGAIGVAYSRIANQVVAVDSHWDNQNPTDVHEWFRTWVFDGSSWSERHPVHSPSGRDGTTMASDAQSGLAFLFGGAAFYNYPGAGGWPSSYGDTWTWDGTDWTERADAPALGSRGYEALTYYPPRHSILLWGGFESFFGQHTDTWQWGATPDAPTGVTATAGVNQAQVTWTAPAGTSGLPVTAYVVTPRIGGNVYPAQTFPGTMTTATVTGLTHQGYSYQFDVAAVTSRGTGPPSAPSSPVLVQGTPGAPTGVAAVAGPDSAQVSWKAPANTGGLPLTGYIVTPYIGTTALPPRTFDASATTRTVTGLARGWTYTFRITALNSVGPGNPSASSNKVIPFGPPGTPNRPASLPGDTTARVTWSTPTNNGGSPITGYVVTPYVNGVAKASTTFASTATTQTLTGLVNGTSYQFRVAAINTHGTGNASGSSYSIVVGTPSPPAFLSATAGTAQATVKFWPPSSNGSPITAFLVTPYRDGVAQPVRTYGPSTNVITVTGLTSGASYTFLVAARNTRGTGPQAGPTAAVKVL